MRAPELDPFNRNNTMPSAISYIRVPVPGTSDESDSLDAQRRQNEEFATRFGYKIIRTFIEYSSGKSKLNYANRPVLCSAIGHSKMGPKGVRSTPLVILVASYDRVSENRLPFEKLLASGNTFKIISTRIGESDFGNLAVVDVGRQREIRKKISDSTKDALANRKANGVKLGNAKSLDIAARLGSESNRGLARQRLS